MVQAMTSAIEVKVTRQFVEMVAAKLGVRPEEVTDDMLKPLLLDAIKSAANDVDRQAAERNT